MMMDKGASIQVSLSCCLDSSGVWFAGEWYLAVARSDALEHAPSVDMLMSLKPTHKAESVP